MEHAVCRAASAAPAAHRASWRNPPVRACTDCVRCHPASPVRTPGLLRLRLSDRVSVRTGCVLPRLEILGRFPESGPGDCVSLRPLQLLFCNCRFALNSPRSRARRFNAASRNSTFEAVKPMNVPVTVLPEPAVEEIRTVEQTSCCIVGGGPGGAMLALFLARRGVPVTLLEMHKDFDREFRGDTIHPSVMEILDQIGLSDKLHEIPHTKVTGPTIQFADGPFRPFDLGRLKTRFPYILLVPQERFLEFITGEAAEYPQFKLVMRANVQQMVEEDGVVRGVRYLAPDGLHELRATLTVGADGRFSLLRRLAGIEPIKTSPPMDILWFRLPKLPGEPEITGGLFGGIGRGRIFIMLERTDYWQAGLVFPKGQYQELRAKGVETVRQSITEIEPHFARHAEYLTDWHQLTLLSVESSRCPLWHKPGLLLIGEHRQLVP